MILQFPAPDKQIIKRAELQLCQPQEIVTIQVRGERVLSENRLERKRRRPKKARSKRRQASREKRARKLERTLKLAESGERNAKENKKRHM